MEHEIAIVHFKCGKDPTVRTMRNTTVSAMNAVGGYFDVMELGDGMLLVYNEDKLHLGLRPNRILFNDNRKPKKLLFGSFFVCADADGEFGSLNGAQIAKAKEIFSCCVIPQCRMNQSHAEK